MTLTCGIFRLSPARLTATCRGNVQPDYIRSVEMCFPMSYGRLKSVHSCAFCHLFGIIPHSFWNDNKSDNDEEQSLFLEMERLRGSIPYLPIKSKHFRQQNYEPHTLRYSAAFIPGTYYRFPSWDQLDMYHTYYIFSLLSIDLRPTAIDEKCSNSREAVKHLDTSGWKKASAREWLILTIIL